MAVTSKIALAAASGYVLGRRRKLKLAITVGSMLAGQRIATNPRALLAQGQRFIESNEQLSQLSDQVRDELLTAARAAGVAAAGHQMDRLSDSINQRTGQLTAAPGDEQAMEDVEAEPAEEFEDEAGEEDQEVDTSTPRRSRSTASGSTGTAKKSAAKKSAAKKSAAKKSAAKKSTAKKSAAKRTARRG